MNLDTILRLAQEANIPLRPPMDVMCSAESIVRFAALVAAAERESILEMCKEGLWDAAGIRYHLNKRQE